MTPEQINAQKVQRLLDNPELIWQLRANLALGHQKLADVLAEVLNDNQRQLLRDALTT